MKRVTWGLLLFLFISMPCSIAATSDNAIKYSAKIAVSADKTVSVIETLTFASSPTNGTFVYTIPAKVGNQTDSIANVRVEGCTTAIAQTDSGVELSLSNMTSDPVRISYERIASADSEEADTLAVRLLPVIELPIRSATVSLVMPSRVDVKSISIDLAQNISFDYSVTAGVLSGSLLSPLPPDSSVLANFTLPEGYFVQSTEANESQQPKQPTENPSTDGFNRVLLVAVALLSALSLLAFALSRGRGALAPGAWFDPAQAGYVLRGYSKNGDLVALLPYWAGLGIIRMELLHDRRIRFTRLAQLPENASVAQRGLFAALFCCSDELTLGHLPAGFRAKANQARTELSRVFEQDDSRVFTKASYRAKGFIVICLFFTLGTLLYCALPMGGAYAFFSSIWMSIALSLLSLFGLIPLLDRLFAARALSVNGRILCVVGLLLYFAVVVALAAVAHRLHPQLTELAIVAGIACMVLAFLYLFSRRRTHAGLKQLQTLNVILRDLRSPSSNQPADNTLLYAYSISLRPVASDVAPWGRDVTHTLRDMQRIWNKLARANTIGWRFYQP